MKTTVKLLSLLVISSFVVSTVASAGLVDHNRRKARAAGGGYNRAAPPARAATPAPAAAPEVKVPDWMKAAPKVNTKTEARYDANRDGKLQTPEVKIMLRDVIQAVEAKGGYTVDSDVLKAYDKNRDGVINRYELMDLKSDAG